MPNTLKDTINRLYKVKKLNESNKEDMQRLREPMGEMTEYIKNTKSGKKAQVSEEWIGKKIDWVGDPSNSAI